MDAKQMEASSTEVTQQPQMAPPPGYSQAADPQAPYPQAPYPQATYLPGTYAPAPVSGPSQPQNWSQLNTAPVVGMQPTTAVYVTQPVQSNVYVPDQVGCSIFTMLCCCFYLGIPALILANQANSLKHIDPQRALQKAKTAKALNIAAVILGTIAIIAVVALQLTVRTTTSSSSYYYNG